MKRRRIILFALFFLFAARALAFGENQNKAPKLFVFHSPSCSACQNAKANVLPAVEQEFKGKIAIEYRDITVKEEYLYLLSLEKEYRNKEAKDLPIFFFNGQFLAGKDGTLSALRILIASSLHLKLKEEAPALIRLEDYFKSFKPAVVIGAGLIDGINPCAFTVIVFFMSFLALQGYRKRELIGIGLTFIFAVFLTYLLIGLGVFQFLYRLEGFWVAAKIINYGIGAFSIVLGGVAAYDYFKYKRTKATEGLVLQLPAPIKNKIHAIIGGYYRKSGEKKNLIGLVLSALITGFLVSLLEAVCTGQTYLPTIVFIFKGYHDVKALVFLLIYNLMFVVPLFVIFLFALLGVSSAEFSKFLREKLGLVKILMAALFFGLGLFLIWRG